MLRNAFAQQPSGLLAYALIVASLAAVIVVGLWNASRYPVSLGYDSAGHLAYLHDLIYSHHIPNVSGVGEYNTPPGYYALSGTAARIGYEWLGWRNEQYLGAQYFNVLLVFLTALSVLWLARVVAPRAPPVWAGAVGFFAFLPVVAKTAAMVHPETLNMLCSAAAVAAATQILVRRRFTIKLIAVLGLALILGQLTRTSSIFTFGAVTVAFIASVLEPAVRSSIPWRRVGISGAVIAILALPWIGRQVLIKHQQPFGNGATFLKSALHGGAAASGRYRYRFFDVRAQPIFSTPFRPHGSNEALPTTYTEIWGDWIGAFAWSPYSAAPWPPALRLLKDQAIIGVLPTILAIAGWIGLSLLALRRRALLAAALLPPFAVGGYLLRSYLVLTPDGDLLKASYALTSVPVWALGFGLAMAWIGGRSRLLALALTAVFVIFAVLELRFMMYGIRDHRPIF